MCAGPWKDAVSAFAELGFQCPQFKNPTDYFMKVASDVENIPKLAEAQNDRWARTGSKKFSSRNALDAVPAAETRTGDNIHMHLHYQTRCESSTCTPANCTH
jgi:hypothetical protein